MVAAASLLIAFIAPAEWGGLFGGLLGSRRGDLGSTLENARKADAGRSAALHHSLPPLLRPSNSPDLVGATVAELEPINFESRIGPSPSVNRIIRPEEARGAARPVPVVPDEMGGGAGIRSVGGQTSASKSALSAGTAPRVFADKATFSGGVSASNGVSLNDALKKVEVPAPDAGKRAGGAVGTLTRMQYDSVRTRNTKALGAARQSGGDGSAFSQLVYGRANVQLSAPPDCSSSNGCPSEVASNNVAAVYDGTPSSLDGGAPGVLSDAVAGISPGAVGAGGGPSGATVGNRMIDADKLLADKKKCEEAYARHRPEIDRLSAIMTNMGNKRQDLDCRKFPCRRHWPQGDAACWNWVKNWGIFSGIYYRLCRCSSYRCTFIDACHGANSQRCQMARGCPFSDGHCGTAIDCNM